ncbi:MAG: sigma-E processing peptidase SpoIIGA [Chitinophagales bacterium]
MITGHTIYIDVLFLENLIMDFFILWATSKLVGIKTHYGRIITASILGAIYAIGNVFPELSNWYTLSIKVLFSGLMAIIAFWPKGWREFFKLWACFYGVGFVMAGAVIGLSFLFHNGVGQSNYQFSYFWLGGGIACALGLGMYGERMMRERVVPNILNCPVQVRFGTAWCEGHGFIDTGNNLTDPFTHKPVVIAEYHMLKDCFPPDVCQAMDDNNEDLFEALSQTSWAHRIRLIPFSSIGKPHGLLVGVRSDELVVQSGDKCFNYPGLVVGLYRERLSPDGRFQMLLPACIFGKQEVSA